jgi:predicted metal-dependent peptidase
MSSKLKELIDAYKDKFAESKIEPADADPKVRAGVEAIVRNATRDLPDLTDRYMNEVVKHAVIVAVKGTNGEEFGTIAKYRFKMISIDYHLALNRMIKSMRKRGVRPDYYNEEYSMTLDEIQQIKLEYNILQLPAPKINHTTDQVYNRPLEVALANLIKNNYNEQLYSVVTRRELGKQALEDRFDGKNLAVVLYNYQGELDETFLPKPIIVIDANGPVDEKFVQQKIAEVKSKLNHKPLNKTKTTTEQTQGEIQ